MEEMDLKYHPIRFAMNNIICVSKVSESNCLVTLFSIYKIFCHFSMFSSTEILLKTIKLDSLNLLKCLHNMP